MATPEELDAVLPQTQCQACGYEGCLPYARAISQGVDSIDKCRPGGERTLNALAKAMSLDPKPYLQTVLLQYKSTSLVRIRHEHCIGCTKCITACPVDAVIGSAKHMHTILAEACTGCDLCIEVCPVDCIEAVDRAPRSPVEEDVLAEQSRQRYQKREQRLLRNKQERQKKYAQAQALLSGLV